MLREIYKYLATILFLIFTASVQLLAFQGIAKYDLSYAYDEKSEVILHSTTSLHNNEANVYLEIISGRGEDFEKDYSITYVAKSGYEGKTIANGELTSGQLIKKVENKYYYQLKVPAETQEMMCLVTIKNLGTQREFFFDIPIKTEHDFPPAQFILKDFNSDLPIFGNTIKDKQKVYIEGPANTLGEVFCFKYNFKFEPSAPPMLEKSKAKRKSMQIDSIFKVKPGDPIVIDSKGLYFFQNDTTKFEGRAIRVVGSYYPKLVKAEELIEPIIYLSTRLEYKNIVSIDDKKRAMDQYWLKVTNSKERAKRIIRNYFKNVETTNSLFTNYKEGWKTDRGMIYIIFGPPDEVYRNSYSETWIYDKKENMSKIKYTFKKFKNIFTGYHYELYRDKSYEKHWYRSVDLWRKGRMGI